MKHVTILADASFCITQKVAGYGYWIASSRGKKGGGGPISTPVVNVNEAELKALANALYIALRDNYVEPNDCVLMQTDSQAAILAIQRKRTSMTEGEKVATSYILRLAEKNALLLRLKHVKGHSGRQEARFVSNHMCDLRAKDGLAEARQMEKEGKIK